jgi:LmbE family N-acetylglucosaminyl deacetylase
VTPKALLVSRWALAALALAECDSPREPTGPRVLTVIAHPDDDAMFAGSVYKITHTLRGVVDLALVTDGSGGFRYSQLAQPIYDLELTDETVARRRLPAIRRRELEAGGAITGIRRYFYLNQRDQAYTESVDSVFRTSWDSAAVRSRLAEIMARGRYDFVLVHLPIEAFHGHHKGATILTLAAVQDLPLTERPVVLGSFVADKGDTTLRSYEGLPGYPITRVRGDVTPFEFDRTEGLSPDGRLDYRIIVNWLIAEHKSQGTMQLLVNRGEVERFWFFAANDPSGLDATRRLFADLAVPALRKERGG